MSDVTLQPKSANKKQRNTKIWLVVSQLIIVVILVSPVLMILFALLSYLDDPRAAEGFSEIASEITSELSEPGNVFTALLVVAMMLFYPLVAIISTVFSWRSYAKGKYRKASIVTSLPIVLFIVLQFVIPFLLFIVAFIFGYRG